MSFPRYPKYKASGVEWLGDVPEGWEVKPLKYSTLVYTGNSLNETEKKLYESTDPEALPYISSKDIDLETHEVQYENGLRIPKEQCDLKVAQSGTFLLCVEGGSAGRKVALLRHDVCFVNKLCCFSSRQNNKFRFYFAQSQHFKDKFGLSLTGLIGGVSTSLLKNFQIPTPADPEQTAIAEFLDRETGKIDGLVAEQRRLMELLKEKRQAVISHAVTKGLNPHAPMKPSGIEWLGDVPEGWAVKRLKNIVEEPLKYGANESAELDDRTLPRFVRITDIDESGALRDETFKSLPVDVAQSFLLREGDVLLARSGATVGKSFIYSNQWGPACFAGYLIRARLRQKECIAQWLYYFCQTNGYWGYVVGSQIQATIQNVSAEKYANLYLPVPSISEQKTIIKFLETELAKFDTLTAEAQRAIVLLQERRTALISAAVTGQIDVRQQTRN